MVPSLNGIGGNRELVSGLKRALEADRVAHAYLVIGSEGIGKAELARALASALLCTGSDGDACGTCHACRMMDGDGHPDFHEIHPDGQSLKIDQIRELRRMAALSPFSGDRQIFVVHSIDSLTEQAANSFLKLLEEPPDGVYLILLAERLGTLLPTIVSRCQVLKMQGLTREEMASFLAHHHPDLSGEDVRDIVVQCGGLPGRARALALPEERARSGEELAWCRRILAADPPELFKAAEELDKNRDEVEKLLKRLALVIGERLADCRSLRLLGAIGQSRRLIRQNVNIRLVLEVLFLEIWHNRPVTPSGCE